MWFFRNTNASSWMTRGWAATKTVKLSEDDIVDVTIKSNRPAGGRGGGNGNVAVLGREGRFRRHRLTRCYCSKGLIMASPMKGIAVSKNPDEKLGVPSVAGNWALLIVGGQATTCRTARRMGGPGSMPRARTFDSCTVTVKMVANPPIPRTWREQPTPPGAARMLIVLDGTRLSSSF